MASPLSRPSGSSGWDMSEPRRNAPQRFRYSSSRRSSGSYAVQEPDIYLRDERSLAVLMRMIVPMIMMLVVVPIISQSCFSVSVVIASMPMVQAIPRAVVIIVAFVVSGDPIVRGKVGPAIHHIRNWLDDNCCWPSDRNANIYLCHCFRWSRQRNSQNQTKYCQCGFFQHPQPSIALFIVEPKLLEKLHLERLGSFGQ